MTDSNDHARDLPHVDDRTVEELLKGQVKPGPGELGEVAHFLEQMRECVDLRAPSPSPALRYMLNHGAPAAPSEVVVPVPPRGTAQRTSARRRALLAARVGVGIGVTAATIITAAAAGVLPRAAERAVAGVVERLTPFQLPGPHGRAVALQPPERGAT